MVAALKTPLLPRVTPEAYLERERGADTRSEYINGEIVAMAGATLEHVQITANLTGEFYIQLKGKPCRGLSSDLRVKVSAHNDYVYPDVVVVCGEPQYVDTGLKTLVNPTVLIEVLSETTERMDRVVKFDRYQTIAIFTDYVLVSQTEPRVEHYARQSDNQWLLTIYTSLEQTALLPSLGCALRLADIYDRISFVPPPDAQATQDAPSASE